MEAFLQLHLKPPRLLEEDGGNSTRQSSMEIGDVWYCTKSQTSSELKCFFVKAVFRYSGHAVL